MQLQFSKTMLRYLKTLCQDVKNTEVTQELRLPDGMPDIGRILTTWGQVMIRSKEWQGSTLMVTGGVMVWVLYAPEDGTESRSVECWVPYQLKWDLDTDREGPMRVMPLLRFSDARSISSRKIMLRAGVAVSMEAMCPMEAEIYSVGELPDDVQILKKTYPARIPVESGERTFLVDEEITISQSQEKAEKLLGIMVIPEITEKKMLSDKVIFKGMLNLHLVFRDGEGNVGSWKQGIPFSQLSDLDHSYSTDAQADILMAVTSLEADLIETGKLRLKCGLVGQYLVSDRYLLELVEDVYSPQRQVVGSYATLELPMILDERTEYITAEQTIPGQTGQYVEGVFLPDFPQWKIGESSVEMDIPGTFQTLFYDEHDALQGISSRWSGKLKLPADEGTRICVFPGSNGEVQAAVSGGGANLSGSVWLKIRTDSTQGMPMVTGLELGETRQLDPKRPSLVIRKTGGESLWDLAKSMGSTVSAITEANGLASDPVPDQMLLIPIL